MAFKIGIIVALSIKYADVKVKVDVHRCLIKGNLRFEKIKLLVGDYVKINFENPTYPVIEAVLPRKNELYRPSIANIDQVLIISALMNPQFSSFLINKLLTIFNFYHLKIILVFTKIDLVNNNDEVWIKIKAYQHLNFQTFFVSNQTKEGIEQLKLIFPNNFSLLTGTSGVGKSSTLNSLNLNLKLWTQEISAASNRGKHTTTSTTLYFLLDGIIADTPGFSVFQLQGLQIFDIATNFPSFNNIWKNCKFRTCLHLQEPQCAIKTAVKNNVIPEFFYEDYCKIIAEFKKINQK